MSHSQISTKICSGKFLKYILLYVMFYCAFVSFPYGVLGKVWNLMVSIPDLCLLSYFDSFLTSLNEFKI